MFTQSPTPKMIEMLNRIVPESEREFDAALRRSGARLKAFTQNGWKASQDWIDSFKSYNRWIAYEEKEGRVVGLLVFQINDSETRSNLGLKDDFMIFTKAITEKEFRGTGLLSKLAMESVQFAQTQTNSNNLSVIGCVSAKEIVQDGYDKIQVMSLDRYAGMMMRRPGTQIQVRYSDSKGQYGRESYPIDSVMTDNKLDNTKVERLVRHHKPKAEAEGKDVMGFYVKNQISRL